MGILYTFFEADDLDASEGTPLVPGTEYRDHVIPDGELWRVNKLTGSASAGGCEIELLYSDDAGTTWSNPFDTSQSKLSCLHLADGNPVNKTFPSGFEFTGNSDQVILRIVCKNFNTDKIAEIVATLEGDTR